MDARRATGGFRRRTRQYVEESDRARPIHAEHELGPQQTCPGPPQQQKAGEKCGLGNGHIESGGDHLQVTEADFLLSVFQVRNEAPVDPDMLGHIDLSPPTAFPQFAQTLSESDADIIWHAPIMPVDFRR